MSDLTPSGDSAYPAPAEALRFGWWNTRLALRGARRRDHGKTPVRFEDVLRTVDTLLVEDKLDFLALGEILPESIRRLDVALRDGWRVRLADNALAVGLIFREDRLVVTEPRVITSFHAGRERERILSMWIREPAGGPEIFVCLAHWPSRQSDPQAKSERETLGRALSEQIGVVHFHNPNPLVLVMGDFNDEPYDNSMTRCLESSRDRTLVRSRRKLLYNPFWRWLGEQQHAHEESDGRRGAGSYFYGGDGFTRWFTFDQALVSAAFLDGPFWRLDETNTRVLASVPLSERGRPLAGFDHMPIMVAITRMTRS